MADIHTNLHPEGDLSTNVYPNIQPAENVPDSSIESGKLADGIISTAKLADSSVTVAKLADGAVSSAKLADSSVTEAKLADGSVTDAKLASTLSFAIQSDLDEVLSDIAVRRYEGRILLSNRTGSVLPYPSGIELNKSNFAYMYGGGRLDYIVERLTIESVTLRFPDGAFASLHDIGWMFADLKNAADESAGFDLIVDCDVKGSAYGFAYQSGIRSISVTEGHRLELRGSCGVAFSGCSLLTSIKGISFEGATDLGGAFYRCGALAEFDVTGVAVSIDLSSTALAHDALVKVIGNLETVTAAQILTIGSEKLALLSQDEILVATGKGWTVA